MLEKDHLFFNEYTCKSTVLLVLIKNFVTFDIIRYCCML